MKAAHAKLYLRCNALSIGGRLTRVGRSTGKDRGREKTGKKLGGGREGGRSEAPNRFGEITREMVVARMDVQCNGRPPS